MGKYCERGGKKIVFLFSFFEIFHKRLKLIRWKKNYGKSRKKGLQKKGNEKVIFLEISVDGENFSKTQYTLFVSFSQRFELDR